MNFPLRLRPSLKRVAIPVALMLLAALLVTTWSDPEGPAKGRQAATGTNNAPTAQTSFQLGSLNLLGAGHTDGKNPRKGYAKSPVRLKYARQALDNNGVDVVGFQEMHATQATNWVKNNSSVFGTYPGTSLRLSDAQRSIAWRSSKFTLVQAHTLDIPYFHGRIEKMPYVLLQHKTTGQLAWVYNAHNPANVEGNALKWRKEGWNRLIALVKRLRTQYPGVPVFTTGDMNDTRNFFCQVVGNSELRAANGGTASKNSCTPPAGMIIDWITGTAPNVFSDYSVIRDSLIKKTTDHPLVRARINLPGGSMTATPISKAITVSVEGLRGYTVQAMLKQGKLPNLARMQSQGSSALNARTAVESTAGLPNLVSMISGRTVARSSKGHGVSADKYRGLVHAAAGNYVTSVFDMVANTGGSTSLYSSTDSTRVIATSYNSKNSRPRVPGEARRTKIGRYGVYKTDAAVVAQFSKTAGSVTTYTHLHLTNPAKVGRKYGFGSARYQTSLRNLDRNLGRVRATIAGSNRMLGQTMLVVMGTNGGYKKTTNGKTLAGNYTVPIFVTGAAIAPNANLYSLNAATRRNPGSARVSYAARAITTADVANLVLAALKIPAIPGSTQNRNQSLTALKPANRH